MREQVSLWQLSQFRIVWARSIKEVVDETCKVNPEGFINASNIETAKKIKYLTESV